MRAKRRGPLRAGTFDLQQAPAVRMVARDGRNLDRFAAKGVRHIHIVPVDEGDAVAEMADVVDDQALNHGARR
jgi:hypothetical protein